MVPNLHRPLPLRSFQIRRIRTRELLDIEFTGGFSWFTVVLLLASGKDVLPIALFRRTLLQCSMQLATRRRRGLIAAQTGFNARTTKIQLESECRPIRRE